MDVSFRFLLSVFRGSAVGAGVEVSASRAERRGRSVESGAVTSRSCVALPGPRLPAEETPAARNATLPWPLQIGIEWDVFAGAWAPVGGAEESERGRGVVLYPSLSGAPPHAPPPHFPSWAGEETPPAGPGLRDVTEMQRRPVTSGKVSQ